MLKIKSTCEPNGKRTIFNHFALEPEQIEANRKFNKEVAAIIISFALLIGTISFMAYVAFISASIKY